MSRAASRQTFTYPGMEHTQVAPEQWHDSAHLPSPRLTAALLRALSTPKAMSAARALSMLYPGLERPEVIEQLQKQSEKHATSPGRQASEWLSHGYPGMERGLSIASQQGQPRQGQQHQQAQRAGSLSRHPSDWLSYPGLERGFSVQNKKQQPPRSCALSSAESIKQREPLQPKSDRACEQDASAQYRGAQQFVSAFAPAAAVPMSRESSGQFSYPGMERGFSGVAPKAARHQSPHKQQQQSRAASMQRNPSDWLSYPGMERGLSTQQPQQKLQQPPMQTQQNNTASMLRNPSEGMSYPGMERGLSRNLPQGKQQSAQQSTQQRSPLRPQAERAGSLQRNPSDWLSYPGMERGLSMHPQQQQKPPTAVHSRGPMSRQGSDWLSYPGMERGLSRQLPTSRLHQALCLETSYSVRSNASDSMWPGMEQCFDMRSRPSSSRLHEALCLETAPSFSSNYSDCDWPGLEADFDCCSSPESRLHEALCMESAASMRSNVSDCYYPGLERLMSMRSAAPALQRLLSIGEHFLALFEQRSLIRTSVVCCEPW